MQEQHLIMQRVCANTNENCTNGSEYQLNETTCNILYESRKEKIKALVRKMRIKRRKICTNQILLQRPT
eukprot:g60067.t1